MSGSRSREASAFRVCSHGILEYSISIHRFRRRFFSTARADDRRSLDLSKLATGGFANLLNALPPGMSITVPPQLFTKIEDTQVADWTARFGGG